MSPCGTNALTYEIINFNFFLILWRHEMALPINFPFQAKAYLSFLHESYNVFMLQLLQNKPKFFL